MKTTGPLDTRRPSLVNRRAFLGTTLGIAAVAPAVARHRESDHIYRAAPALPFPTDLELPRWAPRR